MQRSVSRLRHRYLNLPVLQRRLIDWLDHSTIEHVRRYECERWCKSTPISHIE